MKSSIWKQLARCLTAAMLVAVPAAALPCLGSTAWRSLDVEVVALEATAFEATPAGAPVLDDWQDTRHIDQRALASATRLDKALQTAIAKLTTQAKHTPRGNRLALQLLTQKLTVLKAEKASLDKIKSSIASGRLAGKAATARLSLYQAHAAQVNRSLTQFQAHESQTHTASQFTFSRSF